MIELNRHRWSRFAAALLATFAMLFAVVACGSEQQEPAAKEAPSTAQSSKAEAPESSTSAKAKRTAKPGTVNLPRGGTAKLVRKEVDNSGTLPIPDALDEATWWGAGIGSDGAMLLSGHVNWKGKVGPFNELWQSKRGDVAVVADKKGHKQRYKVSDVVTLNKQKLAKHAKRLFGQQGKHRLVLVTCGGRYVGGEDGYEENRIVIAQPA